MMPAADESTEVWPEGGILSDNGGARVNLCGRRGVSPRTEFGKSGTGPV